jgi:solute carrier family 25 (adenine nucleotide translocator) protein 4/5/6/31
MMMTSGAAVKYSSSIDCGRQILKKEGFSSLMRGAGGFKSPLDGVVGVRAMIGGATLAGFHAIAPVYASWRGKRIE